MQGLFFFWISHLPSSQLWSPLIGGVSGSKGVRGEGSKQVRLGRALGQFIFPLNGLKRILFTNIFQRLKSPT